MKPKICFFAKVQNRDVLEEFEFYSQDLRILRELGVDIQIAISPEQIRRADLYFVWWWTWAFFPLLLANWYRRPMVITGTFDPWAFDRRHALHRSMIKFALDHCQANIFVSQLECEEVPKKLRVRNPIYIPHAVDTELYRPGTGPRQDFIFTVSHLPKSDVQRKCLGEAIKAVHLLNQSNPSVRFVIAGRKADGYSDLVRLINHLGAANYIELPGAITRQEKIDLMQKCRVYLSPSRYEGFGLAILEAMSCGAPVVSSPVGAVPEVVGDAGLLVDGTSPQAIAEALNRYLDNPALQQDMGLRARQRAETVFPYERRKQELSKVITSLLG